MSAGKMDAGEKGTNRSGTPYPCDGWTPDLLNCATRHTDPLAALESSPLSVRDNFKREQKRAIERERERESEKESGKRESVWT